MLAITRAPCAHQRTLGVPEVFSRPIWDSELVQTSFVSDFQMADRTNRDSSALRPNLYWTAAAVAASLVMTTCLPMQGGHPLGQAVSFTYVSPIYHIDRRYKSMEGPGTTASIVLNQEDG